MGQHSTTAATGHTRSFALRRLYLYTLFFLHSSLFVTAASGPRYSNCSYFVTNGTASSQYDYYRFYDFRNISSDSWDDIKEPKDPNNITAGASTSDGSWQFDWLKREGYREAGPNIGQTLLPIDYQPDAVQVANISGPKDNNAVTALTFLSSRQNVSSQQSSGMDFGDQNILYMSLRFRARLSGAPGACAAFFAYKNDSQEADIELLTRDPEDIVGFNTQPTLDIHDRHIPGSHWNMSIPGNASRETWINYRMDWVADQVVWYTNGIEMANTSVNVPSAPCRLSLSLWGNGGTWTRNMTLGKSALLEVQWLEVAFNLSGARPSKKGTVTCELDADNEGDERQPYIFPPAHESRGSKIDFSILLTCIFSFLAANLL